MVRVALSVEGLTEERFVKEVLAEHFYPLDIYLYPVKIQTPLNVYRVAKEIRNLAYNHDFVTTLYDFYGFQKKDRNETKISLEEKILSFVDDDIKDQVIPYIQMYEYEGLLFSSPSTMAEILEGEDLLEWSRSIVDEFDGNPELINNSYNTCPSRRLASKSNYKKGIHGPQIAKSTGVRLLREKCKGFDQWLAKLENLTS